MNCIRRQMTRLCSAILEDVSIDVNAVDLVSRRSPLDEAVKQDNGDMVAALLQDNRIDADA